MCLLDKDTPPFVYQWGKKNFHRETLHLSKKKKKRSKTWIWSVGLSTQFLVKWLVKKTRILKLLTAFLYFYYDLLWCYNGKYEF